MKLSHPLRACALFAIAATAVATAGCPDRHLLGVGPPDTGDEMTDAAGGIDSSSSPPDGAVADGGPPDVPQVDVGAADAAPSDAAPSDASIAADEIIVCDTRFGVLQDLVLVNDAPSGSVPSVQPMNAYRVAGIQLSRLYSKGATEFPSVMNRVFAQSFCPGGGPDVGPIDALLRFEWRQDGQGRVTACQGTSNADGTYACVAGTSMQTDAGRFEGRPGHVTWGTNPVRVEVPLTVGGTTYTIHLILRMNEFQQPIASSANLVAAGDVVAAAADLCAITLTTPSLIDGCGLSAVNLLDLIDGPAAACGQDGSADVEGAMPSCTTGFADPYNLPDNYLEGLEPSTGFGLRATIEFTPIQLTP